MASKIRVIIQSLTLDERIFPLEIEASDTVEGLKLRIYREVRFHQEAQRLEFAGKWLENGWSVKDYDIKEGSLIYCVLRYHNIIRSNRLPDDLRLLASHYNIRVKICRRCYARLPYDATYCRKKKCHSHDIRDKKAMRFDNKEERILQSYYKTHINMLDTESALHRELKDVKRIQSLYTIRIGHVT